MAQRFDLARHALEMTGECFELWPEFIALGLFLCCFQLRADLVTFTLKQQTQRF